MKQIFVLALLCLALPVAAQDHHHAPEPEPKAEVPTAPAPQLQPKTPIPVLTDADRAAAFPVLKASHNHDQAINTLIKVDRLEGWDNDSHSSQSWEVRSWTGNDIHRLWLRTEGEREAGAITSAHLEALYGQAHGPWWDVVGGIRHDFAPEGSPDTSQTWAAVGVQGLVPYMFEVAATAYVSDKGQIMINAAAEYDIRFSYRVVLQPSIEATAFSQDDPLRGLGSGLSSVEAGLRLRYQVTPQFAPYMGVVYEKHFGQTADYKQLTGQSDHDTRWVSGISLWF